MKGNKFSLMLEMMIKNADLVNARKDVGLSVKEAAAAIGVSYGSYLNFEGMRSYPSQKSMRKIMEFYREYGIELKQEKVFPEELREAKPKRYIKEREIPVESLLYLSSQPREIREIAYVPAPDESAIEREVSDVVEKVLKTLSKREEKVIRMRYGLGEDENTQQETADYFGITPPRVRQIEQKALRLMRHPSRAKKLKNAKWG